MADENTELISNNDVMPSCVSSYINIKCVSLITLSIMSLGVTGVSLTMLMTTSTNASLYVGLLTSNIGLITGLIISPKKLLRRD